MLRSAQRPLDSLLKGLESIVDPAFNAVTATTTLLFIDNGGIEYSAYSDDPIFPARDMDSDWSHGPRRWRDSGLARTVLGCSDENFIRDTRNGHEWYQLGELLHDRPSDHSWNITSPSLNGTSELPFSDESLTALRLLGLVIQRSNIGQAVESLRHPWLDAASRIIHGRVSLPLDSHQWHLESQKAFNISLAGMQIAIINMAQGKSGGDLPPLEGTYNMLNGSLVDPCGMLKVSADGMRNLSVLGLISMLGFALAIWVLTVEVGESIVLVKLFHGCCQPLRQIWDVITSRCTRLKQR